MSFSSSSSLPPRVYQVLREPCGAGLCVSPLTVLLLPGMPLSAALCLFSKYSSLRSDWGHLLYESFPQMPCVFLLLTCSRVYRWLLFALRSGIPSSPPITLLETFVYISPLPARLQSSQVQALFSLSMLSWSWVHCVCWVVGVYCDLLIGEKASFL